MHNDKTYIIIEREKVTKEMIANAIQSAIITLRTSVDFSKTVLKWSGETPECFKGIKTYTHKEILGEMKKDDWSEED